MITANSNNLFYNETYSTVEIFDVQLNMYVVKRKLVIFFVTDVAAYRKRFAWTSNDAMVRRCDVKLNNNSNDF